MTLNNRRDVMRILVKDPMKYLAYRGIRTALKRAGHSLRNDSGDFNIIVVPPGSASFVYKSAMRVLLDAAPEEWGEQYGEVRLANPLKKKSSLEKPISVFDLNGLRVLIAGSINEVPLDVRYAANKVLSVAPPSASDINAARRLLGRSALSDEVVRFLVSKPQNVIVAAIYRRSVEFTEIVSLFASGDPAFRDPDLFELPGFDELKTWARSLKDDIVRWRSGELAWREISRGALLSGPPGTGKTLFARALANTLNLRLITTTVGAWQSAGYLNDTLAEMRKSFDEANSSGGAVFFIDEFDSIGSRPARPTGKPNDQYWQIVVNEFLNQCNGIQDGVVIVTATNYPEWIDPAILRAGRIERHYVLRLPDRMTRAEILTYHLGDSLSFESLLALADDLEGKSPAYLEEISRGARKIARDQGRGIELRDVEAMLPEKIEYTLEQQFQLAVHEAGHALVALSFGYAKSATIEIRKTFDPTADGHLGGRTSYELIDDHFPTESGLLNRIAICLAGMAAEVVVLANRSIGSGGVDGSDVERATSIARRMVGSYGLGSTPLYVTRVEAIGKDPLPAELEDQVIEILRNQYERAIAVLANEKNRLIELACEALANQVVKIQRDEDTDAA